jgi:hypothetical protein
MSDVDVDEIVVCPTCTKHVARPDEGDEEAHLQPCSNCGYTLILVTVVLDDDGQVQVRTDWTQGEGARLLMEDAAKAISLADDFLSQEEAEEERIDAALLDMRRERAQQERN